MGKVVKVKNLYIGQGKPKICAIVLGETVSEILAMVEQANQIDCDLIEFRADFYANILDPEKAKDVAAKVRHACRKPIIFTCRRKEEGGKQAIGLDAYKKLLKMVSDCYYAELIDVEASAIPDDKEFVDTLKDNGSYVIISKHDFVKTPMFEEIIQDFSDMKDMGADIVKVAYMPNSKRDVLNLINASVNMANIYDFCPIIAISMGHLGTVTRIIGEFMESAITFASITKSSAPGQIPIDGLESVLNVIHENFKKVFLIGFMGTGKTAVANALASNYGLKKIDLDAYIESKEHTTIADIFANQSESVFRDKETKHLRHVIKGNYQVISLGGGVVLRQENIEMIKEKGVIVLLTASAETIRDRVKNDPTRPRLGDNFDLDYVKELMKSREELYNSVADVVIDTENKNIDEICKEIVETLGFLN